MLDVQIRGIGRGNKSSQVSMINQIVSMFLRMGIDRTLVCLTRQMVGHHF
jgi:hypothetical protein